MDFKHPRGTMRNVCALLSLALAASACGGGGGGSDEPDPSAPNQDPVANPGTETSIVEGNTVTLSAAGSSDPDGSIVSYSWTQTDGPAVTFQGADTVMATFEPPLTDTRLVLTFQLSVTDNDGATDLATTSVAVEPSQPPVVDAGDDFEAVERELVSLDASVTDVDGTVAVYSWVQSAGPAVSLTGADTEDPSFTAPVVTDITELAFRLNATDGTADMAADVVTVTVHPNEPPEIAVHFPCSGCRFYGDAVSVTGAVTPGTDNTFVTSVDGIDNLSVYAGGQSITAIVQTDGQWIAQNIPVPGTSTELSLLISVTDRFGETVNQTVDLSYEPTLTSFLIAHDPVTPDLAYFFERNFLFERLFSVDLGTGTLTRLYESDVTHQETMMVIDQGSTRVFLNDLVDGIFAIDLNTGISSIVSNSSNGMGPDLTFPLLMALDTDDNRLVVYDAGQAALYLVDTTTGDRLIISDNGGAGSGPPITSPDAVAVDSVNNIALLHETGNTFLSVDLGTGDRAVLPVTGDPAAIIASVTSMDFDSQRAIVAVLDETGDSIQTVNPANGNRALHSTGAGLTGFEAMAARQLSVDVVSNRYVINDFSTNITSLDTDRLLSVDSDTGERSVIFDDAHGSGPSATGNATLAFDTANNALFLASTTGDNIIRVDVTTGDRQLISDLTTGVGTAFGTIRDIVLDSSANRALVVDAGNASLMAVNLANGDRSIVTDIGVGTGPALSVPVALETDLDNDRAFVLDQGLQAVVAVDLSTGERTIVSDNSNAGPVLLESNGLALDEQNNRLLVAENGLGSTAETQLLAVDLASGDRTTVSGFTVGNGPFLNNLRDVILLDNSDLAIVSGGTQFYRVDLNTGNRQILAGSGIANGESILNSFSIAYDAANAVFYTWGTDFEAVFQFDVLTGDRVVVSK